LSAIVIFQQPNGSSMGTLAPKLSLISTELERKGTLEGVRGRWKDNLRTEGPFPLHHKILCQPLCVRGACLGHYEPYRHDHGR
jgi:hypothetical protein